MLPVWQQVGQRELSPSLPPLGEASSSKQQETNHCDHTKRLSVPIGGGSSQLEEQGCCAMPRDDDRQKLWWASVWLEDREISHHAQAYLVSPIWSKLSLIVTSTRSYSQVVVMAISLRITAFGNKERIPSFCCKWPWSLASPTKSHQVKLTLKFLQWTAIDFAVAISINLYI